MTFRCPHAPRRGFTLVQMIVTIGIMIVLFGVALPAIMAARNKAKQSAITFQLQAIATALDAYRADFKSYPPVDAGPANPLGDTGAFTLVRLLIAPAEEKPVSGTPGPDELYDGKDGAGFRRTPGGKVYGPYLSPDGFRFAVARDNAGTFELSGAGYKFTPREWWGVVITDTSDKPILYAPTMQTKPRFKKPDKTAADNFCFADRSSSPDVMKPADKLFFDLDGLLGGNNITAPEINAYRQLLLLPGETPSDLKPFIKRTRVLLGDANANGLIEGDETSNFGATYLLWSAGVDGLYGNAEGKRVDDVLLLDGGR